MVTTTAALSDVLQDLAAESLRLRALESELTEQEATLAEGFERLTLAQRDSAIWAEATAAANRRWRVLIDDQLCRWSRHGNVHQALVALRNAGQQQQMED